jgi:hypothetical protein
VTVADLLARMTSEELSEWQSYAALTGGLRDRRAAIQSAQLAAIMANAHRRKGAPPFRTADFMPPDPDAAEVQPAKQPIGGLAALFRTVAAPEA